MGGSGVLNTSYHTTLSPMQELKKLKVLSWNVNGLGDRVKRSMVLQHIRRHSPDLILLQETHLKREPLPCVKIALDTLCRLTLAIPLTPGAQQY